MEADKIRIMFRAYDVVEHKMYDVCKLDNTGDYNRQWWITPEGENYSTSNIILLQYIGKTDAVGNYLFNSDHVHFVAHDAKGIEYDDKGTIRWDEEECGYVILADGDSWPIVCFRFVKYLYRIGNLYMDDEE